MDRPSLEPSIAAAGQHARDLGWLALLLAGGALGTLGMNSSPTTSGGVWPAILGAVLTSAGLLGLGVRRNGWRPVVTSPLTAVVVLIVCLFVLRPVGLIVDPGMALPGLASVGFTWGDVARAVGLGTTGFAIFGVAYLLAWRRSGPVRDVLVQRASDRRLAIGMLGALAMGCALWTPAFVQAGGFNTLLDDPASIHLDQFGAGYGAVGLALCLGAFLVALWLWLREQTPALLWMLVVAGGVSTVASACMQTRGPMIATVAAGVALVIRRRVLRPRTVMVWAMVGLLLLYGLFFMRSVREFSQTQPLGVAIESAAELHPLSVPGADFAEFDGLVALERFVPAALPRLEGSSLTSIPGTFVPRQLWDDKPYPIDLRFARRLYGAPTDAGTPFTLVGELLWNFGALGALAGMAVAGLLAGFGWRALTSRASGSVELFTALIFGYSYLLLTRPLGPMMLTAAFGLTGLAGAAWLMRVIDPIRGVKRLLVGRRMPVPDRA